MKKRLYPNILLVIIMLHSLTSCDMGLSDNNSNTVSMYVSKGIYILNEGVGNNLPGSIAYYDIASTKILAGDIFQTMNGNTVGYEPSDMYIYGSRCYIAAGGNKALYVTDTLCKIQKTIKLENRTPVAITGYDGKVYVSYAEGYLGQIDTLTFNVNEVAVGKSPAGVAATNNKIYVANSGNDKDGYGNTITVVDAKTLSVTNEIEVGVNPYYLLADYYGDIYVITLGDGQSGSEFWRFNSEHGDAVKETSIVNPQKMALSVEGCMVILRKTIDGEYDVDLYDTLYDAIDSRFLQETTIKEEITAIGSDLINGYVYLGVSNGEDMGKVLVYSYYGRKIAELSDIGRVPKVINSRYSLETIKVQ